MTKLIPGQDLFIFLIDECLGHTKYTSKSSVFIGLGQLMTAEIIARGPSDSLYFINPLVAFNGNRVSYVKTYVKRKRDAPQNENKFKKQLDMFNDNKGANVVLNKLLEKDAKIVAESDEFWEVELPDGSTETIAK